MDRVCALAGFALLGVGCWWKAEPGVVPIVEAAKLPVLHTTDAEVGQVTATAWVRSGSAHEPVGQEGLSCAVIYAQLSTSLNKDAARFERLSQAGFDWELDVGRELVQLRLLAEPSVTEDLASLLGDVLLTKPLPDVSPLKPVLDGESNRARSTFLDWLYAGHPYGHAPDCGKSRIPTWTANQMRYFVEDRYIRMSTQIAVETPTGNATTDQMAPFEELQQRLEALPASLYEDVSPRMVPRPFEARLALAADADGQVWMGWGTQVHPGHPDWTAFLIATELLSLRLKPFQEAGQIHPPLWIDAQGRTMDWLGLPLIWGWTGVADPNAVVESTIPVVSDWTAGPFTKAELDRVKQLIRARLQNSVQERQVQAGLLGWTSGWERLNAELDSVESDTVVAAISAHLELSDLRVLMGPARQTKENGPEIEEIENFSVDVDVAPGYDWKAGVPIRLSLQEP